ncbi:MAG: lamin tail domain-containing protein [Verrucomicrobia bacterium]|nr:lamin tail domain-containing protein [Verrucomicrobiota bacterium]
MKVRGVAVVLAWAAGVSAWADATLVFNEVMYHPATHEPVMEWVELYNQLAVDLDVSGWSLGGEAGYTFPPGTRVPGRGFVVVAIDPAALAQAAGAAQVLGPFTNRLSNAGGTLRLCNNDGRLMDEVTYGTEGDWPAAPDGAGPSLAKLDEDLGSAEPANWSASGVLGGTPGAANQPRVTITTTTRTLVPLDHVWRYNASGADLGTAWREPGYDDAAWALGGGVLAQETHASVAPLIHTVLPLTNPSGQRIITYYFRTHFTLTNNPAACSLAAANLLDDGVVVYLNGTEIYRYRVASGQNYQTLAANQASEGAFETLAFSSPALRQGDNVLAAEVHQVNTGSSDVVFGLRLEEVTAHTNTPPEAAAVLPVAFNEMSAVTNAQFWIELVNLGTQNVALGGCVLSRFGTTNREYALPPATLCPGGFAVLDRAALGFGADPGDRVVLYGPDKAAVLDAIVAKGHPRARWPDGAGGWLVPDIGTPGASNHVALRSEIVINEIMYQHKRFPSTNGLPAQPNPEEWIELFNRGTNAVDLTGWELSGGIRYPFPSGKIVAPGGYLVVARNAAALRASFPAADILGDFSGRLSSRGDRLLLTDARGNPADEVPCYSGGRWPHHAGGGGPSLELRDPEADNATAEAWAASDESARSAWQTVTYRAVAQASLTPKPDTQWREFVFGLLAAGECWIDDLSVLESPTNAPVQLLANGDFEGGLTGWRVLGTHGSSRVVADPGNPGNKVLHLIATGPQEHMHNHIETTLAGGRSVVNGRLYEVSYRVKWLAGNSLLNTRLYFNRVARTTELAVPRLNGTPGARNSRRAPNIGPTSARFAHQPVVPAAGAAVTVTAQPQDPQGVSGCRLFWSVNGGAFTSLPMTLQPDGLHRATIPGSAAGVPVQFYVQAADGLGATAMFPARGPGGGALYRVDDGQANVSLAHHLRIVTTPANAALLHADTNVMSNDNLPCTVIYDERLAYYDVGLRLKASMNGRPYAARVGYHLAFQPDQRFRGVHPAMGIDRRPGDNLPRNEEIVVRHAALAAGGIPSMQMDICRVLAPLGSSYSGPAILTPSYEDEFIETAFEDGGDGALFELEGIYMPTTANADGYKLPQPNSSGNYVDVADHGTNKETYRYNFILKNHRDADDYAPLMAFARPFSLSGAALDAQTRQLMDMDQWLRAYALVTLFGVNDTYTFWLNHNVMFYFRPSDHKAVYLMWDDDFAFARSATDAIVGGQNLGKIINLPSNLRVLYAQLLDLIETTYNPGYMGDWLAHYGPFSGADYTPRTSYIQQRADYVKGVIAAAGGHTAFSVGATNLAVTGSNLVTLSGTAPVSVKTILVNGAAWPVTWTSLTGWSLRLPLNEATNALQVVGLDLRGNAVTNATVPALAVFNGAPESPVGRVVFSEIMFHAAVPGGDYVELFNRSTHIAFDLSGWRVNGLDYTFPAGSFFPPRTHLVLAANRSAYVSAYGSQAGLFDEFNGQLQLDGETLTLLQPGPEPGQETVVDQVRYESVLPWPAEAADGTGSSYELIDVNQDNSRAGNWAARFTPAVCQEEVFIPARTNDGWRLVSLTGSIGLGVGGGQQRLLLYLGEGDGASAIVDDLCLVEGTNTAVGFNYIRNGDFDSGPLLDDPPLTNSWIFGTNYTNSAILGGLTHSGSGALRLECSVFGNTLNRIATQNLSPAPPANSTCTLSFWFWSTNSATNLFVRIQNSVALTTGTAGTNIHPTITPATYIPPSLVSPATNTLSPGASSPLGAVLPPFPSLWINEAQAENLAGVLDDQGDREPWIELYNCGTNTVSLDGLYLSPAYTNLTLWPFPPGWTLGPTQFLVVVCDAQPEHTTPGQLHTSFRLPPATGSVALSRLHNGQPQVLDFLNYTALPADRSHGSFPDGQPFHRQPFYHVTAGGTNDGRPAPVAVFINEWMAANAHVLADPADGDDDDWFELYNPGSNAVDLAGCYLTDTLTNQFKCPITTNGPHVIPPQGYLLVWADEETGQNTDAAGVPRADRHVNFKLAADGEEIGLFAADGTPIDTVTFGPQTNDISLGRYPDGTPNFLFMPGSASPRAPNVLGAANTAPVLDPIGRRVVYLGQTLTFDATAQDHDLPAQTLTFSLDPDPPDGAFISADGAFAWTPPTAGQFTLILRVTDNGTPPCSASETITVEVLAGLDFSRPALNAGTLELTWIARPGLVYAVDMKSDLDAPQWTPLWTNTAWGDSLSFTDSITHATPRRFFRLRLVPDSPVP